MVMEISRMTSPYSVVSEFEGILLKSEDSFSYFMLLAFDASGLIRFAMLLFLWPVIKLLDVSSFKISALKLMIFVATVGLREREIESAARAVLPKFYMDDLRMDTWRVFSSCQKKVVVTRMPRVMVEGFAKEHLRAEEVFGTELIVNGLGFVTGLIRESDIDQSVLNRVNNVFVDRRPHLGLGRPAFTASTTFLSLCEEQIHEPGHWSHRNQQLELQAPKQVIFHDGSLMNRPTPAMALLVLFWFPFGFCLAAIRILFGIILGFILPMWAVPYIFGIYIFGIQVIMKGRPPPAGNSVGVLFVCNHRSWLDPLLVSYALGRNIPTVVSFKHSRLSDLLCPIPLVRFTRVRDVDAAKMKQELSKGDLVVCPEGCNCYQPFVLRFSAMFAELTDKIVPVAINCRVGFFRSRVRSRNGLQYLMSLAMNPTIVYEITFLNQLPSDMTCSSGKSPYDVAKHVQRIMADTLGFECTNLGRKDWYKLLG